MTRKSAPSALTSTEGPVALVGEQVTPGLAAERAAGGQIGPPGRIGPHPGLRRHRVHDQDTIGGQSAADQLEQA